jgi:hypothetical protein
MNAEELIELVYSAGGEITLNTDGSLRVNSPGHLLTPETLELLRHHKQDMIQVLKSREDGLSSKSPHIGQMSLSEFATARRVVPIMSDVLGEKVYFASDNAVIDVDENSFYRGCVVYRASELKELIGTSNEHKQMIHELKKVFGNGRVVAHSSLPGSVQEEMQL